MRFSIVVPVFNTGRHLRQCLAALQSLDYPRDEYEILMVDNNSTDNSLEILNSSGGIRVLRESKQGSYAARNRALQEARGALLAFTDSDCMPDPNWLKNIEAALSDPTIQVVLGSRRPAVNQGLVKMLAEYEHQKDLLVFDSNQPEVYYGFTNNLGVRRSTIQKYGPFVERPRGADTIFVRRVVDGEGCHAVVYRPEICVEHAEMDSLTAYYRKMYTYGRSRQLYRHITHARPLSNTERWSAAKACIREGAYPWYKALGLISILSGGVMAWALGSRVGRWRKPT